MSGFQNLLNSYKKRRETPLSEQTEVDEPSGLINLLNSARGGIYPKTDVVDLPPPAPVPKLETDQVEFTYPETEVVNLKPTAPVSDGVMDYGDARFPNRPIMRETFVDAQGGVSDRMERNEDFGNLEKLPAFPDEGSQMPEIAFDQDGFPINLELKLIQNDDGTKSTEDTVTVRGDQIGYAPGSRMGLRWFNIPTIYDGIRYDPEQATIQAQNVLNTEQWQFPNYFAEEQALSAAPQRSEVIRQWRDPDRSFGAAMKHGAYTAIANARNFTADLFESIRARRAQGDEKIYDEDLKKIRKSADELERFARQTGFRHMSTEEIDSFRDFLTYVESTLGSTTPYTVSALMSAGVLSPYLMAADLNAELSEIENLPLDERLAYASVGGAIAGTLENLGLAVAVRGVPREILGKMGIPGLIKHLEARNGKELAVQMGEAVMTGAVAEGLTEFGQEGTNIVAKAFAGGDFGDGEIGTRLKEATLAGVVSGTTFGGPRAGAKATQYVAPMIQNELESRRDMQEGREFLEQEALREATLGLTPNVPSFLEKPGEGVAGEPTITRREAPKPDERVYGIDKDPRDPTLGKFNRLDVFGRLGINQMDKTFGDLGMEKTEEKESPANGALTQVWVKNYEYEGEPLKLEFKKVDLPDDSKQFNIIGTYKGQQKNIEVVQQDIAEEMIEDLNAGEDPEIVLGLNDPDKVLSITATKPKDPERLTKLGYPDQPEFPEKDFFRFKTASTFRDVEGDKDPMPLVEDSRNNEGIKPQWNVYENPLLKEQQDFRKTSNDRYSFQIAFAETDDGKFIPNYEFSGTYVREGAGTGDIIADKKKLGNLGMVHSSKERAIDWAYDNIIDELNSARKKAVKDKSLPFLDDEYFNKLEDELYKLKEKNAKAGRLTNVRDKYSKWLSRDDKARMPQVMANMFSKKRPWNWKKIDIDGNEADIAAKFNVTYKKPIKRLVHRSDSGFEASIDADTLVEFGVLSEDRRTLAKDLIDKGYIDFKRRPKDLFPKKRKTKKEILANIEPPGEIDDIAESETIKEDDRLTGTSKDYETQSGSSKITKILKDYEFDYNPGQDAYEVTKQMVGATDTWRLRYNINKNRWSLTHESKGKIGDKTRVSNEFYISKNKSVDRLEFSQLTPEVLDDFLSKNQLKSWPRTDQDWEGSSYDINRKLTHENAKLFAERIYANPKNRKALMAAAKKYKISVKDAQEISDFIFSDVPKNANAKTVYKNNLDMILEGRPGVMKKLKITMPKKEPAKKQTKTEKYKEVKQLFSNAGYTDILTGTKFRDENKSVLRKIRREYGLNFVAAYKHPDSDRFKIGKFKDASTNVEEYYVLNANNNIVGSVNNESGRLSGVFGMSPTEALDEIKYLQPDIGKTAEGASEGKKTYLPKKPTSHEPDYRSPDGKNQKEAIEFFEKEGFKYSKKGPGAKIQFRHNEIFTKKFTASDGTKYEFVVNRSDGRPALGYDPNKNKWFERPYGRETRVVLDYDQEKDEIYKPPPTGYEKVFSLDTPGTLISENPDQDALDYINSQIDKFTKKKKRGSKTKQQDIITAREDDNVGTGSRKPRGGREGERLRSEKQLNRQSTYRSLYRDLGLKLSVAESMAPIQLRRLAVKHMKKKFGLKYIAFSKNKGKDTPKQIETDLANLLNSYQNLQVMANVLGLPATALSLDGKLGLALPSKTAGNYYAAFYGADNVMVPSEGKGGHKADLPPIEAPFIIMPKQSTSFAHEWGHAFDWHVMKLLGGKMHDGMMSGLIKGNLEVDEKRWADDVDSADDPKLRELQLSFGNLMNSLFFEMDDFARKVMEIESEIQKKEINHVKEGKKLGVDESKALLKLRDQYKNLIEGGSRAKINATNYKKRSAEFAEKTNASVDYWTMPTEMLARAFEAYIAHKVTMAGSDTEFISSSDDAYNSVAEDLKGIDIRFNMTIPQEADRFRVFLAFDRLMASVIDNNLFKDQQDGAQAWPGDGDVIQYTDYVQPVETFPPWDPRQKENEATAVRVYQNRMKREEARPIRFETMPWTSRSIAKMLDHVAAPALFSKRATLFHLSERYKPKFDKNGNFVWGNQKVHRKIEELISMLTDDPGGKRKVWQRTEVDGLGNFEEAVKTNLRKYSNTYVNIMKNKDLQVEMFTDAEMEQLRLLMTSDPKTIKKAEMDQMDPRIVEAGKVFRQQILEPLFWYAKKAGIDISYVAENAYLPRVLDTVKVLADFVENRKMGENYFIYGNNKDRGAKPMYRDVLFPKSEEKEDGDPLGKFNNSEDQIRRLKNLSNQKWFQKPSYETLEGHPEFESIIQLQKIYERISRTRSEINKAERGEATDKNNEPLSEEATEALIAQGEALIERILKENREILNQAYNDIADAWSENGARDWIERLRNAEADDMYAHSPMGAFTKSRKFGAEADRYMVDFYKPADEAIKDYITNVIRKAEYEKRFGASRVPDGKKEHPVTGARWDYLEYMLHDMETMQDTKGIHVDTDDIKTLRRVAKFITGTQDPVSDGKFKESMDAVHALGTMAMLNRAVFSAVAEPLTVGIQARSTTAGFKAFGLTLQELWADFGPEAFNKQSAQQVRDRRVLAALLGVVDDPTTGAMMAERLAGSFADSPRWSRRLANYFRVTRLQGVTNAQRRSALRIGTFYLGQLADQYLNPVGNTEVQKTKDSKSAKMSLLDLGVPEADLDQFAKFIKETPNPMPTTDQLIQKDGTLHDMGRIYQIAVGRFVDRSIQDPKTADRPMYAETPVGRLVYSIMGFQFAFTRNVLMKTMKMTARELELRDLKGLNLSDDKKYMMNYVASHLMMPLASLYIGQTLVNAVRQFVFDRDRWDERLKKGDLMQYLLQTGVSRSGFFGNFDPVANAIMALKFEADLANLLVGASTTYWLRPAQKIIRGYTNNAPSTVSAEFQVANGIWDMLITPMMALAISHPNFPGPLRPLVGTYRDILGFGTSQLISAPTTKYYVNRKIIEGIYGTDPGAPGLGGRKKSGKKQTPLR